LKRPIPLLIALALLLYACVHTPKVAPAVPPVVYVEKDTQWKGDVRVDGIVHVRKNATLTLLPGTRVLFAPVAWPASELHEGFTGPGFKVEGRVVAVGTEKAPVLFTVDGGKVRAGAWDKLLFTFSTGSRFERCTFEGARYAFHAHFSELSVSRCTFRDNEEGMRLGSSKVRIEDSVFTRNEIRGINFRDCRNEIRRNLIRDNGDGIFLHSKDAGSTIRENSIYGNRQYNLRLGDLHADDIDVSGNWWGTSRENEARVKVYDAGNLPGTGHARLFPLLALPPVTGAEIRGVFVSGRTPVAGAEVRAFASMADGLFGDDFAARAVTDSDGLFRLALPPGRWFVAGRSDAPPAPLFAFPGRNPLTVEPGDRLEVGLPGVAVPRRAPPRYTASRRSGVSVSVTLHGAPVAGVSVQAFRPQAPDFRGPGEASALTGESGTAVLYLPPGKYLLAARKRTGGASLGMVEDGGMFGVCPESPVEIRADALTSASVPLFEKRGLIGGEEAAASAAAPEEGVLPAGGEATLSGRPAAGYIVYFYHPRETVGRPAARSSVVSGTGSFTVALQEPGEYAAFLRKSIAGVPGGVEEERVGPVIVRFGEGRLQPPTLPFGNRLR
jgi:parallel beta-helix repeat protein